MDLLNQMWPYVENTGVPILAGIGLLTFISFIFYLNEIRNIRKMEEHIRKQGNLRGFQVQSFPAVGFTEIFFAFQKYPSIDKRFLTIPNFSRQIETIYGYRRFYRIAIPTILIVTTIGIAVNEIVMD